MDRTQEDLEIKSKFGKMKTRLQEHKREQTITKSLRKMEGYFKKQKEMKKIKDLRQCDKY